jgi:hypothetical protein
VKGVYKGRKPSLTKAQIAEVRQRVANGESKAEWLRASAWHDRPYTTRWVDIE